MTVKVPDSWKDVTVKQFIEIVTLEKGKDYNLKVLSILIDQDSETIRGWSANDLAKIYEHLKWSESFPDEDSYNQTILDKYHLVENLNEFTGGQWWDMEEYMNEFYPNFHRILAMVYTDGKEYDTVTCEARANEILNLPISDVYGAMVFFSIVERRFIRITQDYLMKQALKTLRKNRTPNGFGTRFSTLWQGAMSLKWKQSLN